MRNARFAFALSAAMLLAGSAPSSSFAQQNADPHGQGGPVEPGLQAPQDTVAEDSALPAGTVVTEVRDGADKPRPRVPVTLAIIFNSVAKGESRRQVAAMTDDAGRVRWDNLERGSQMSYRVAVSAEPGGVFSAPPFQLDPAKGTQVVLHTYPVSSDLAGTLVVLQSIVYAELKDDRLQVQQAYNIYNFGKVAWAPADFVLPLPTGFTALTGVQGMGGEPAIEPVDGRGARLRGTFGPGRHSVEYRWQLPYDGDPSLDFSIGMPPNLAAARVMVVASQAMKVDVEGFPPVKPARDGQGNSIVETERELRREDAPVRAVRVQLSNIPVPGPARLVASALAAVVIALGFVYSRRGKSAPAREKSGRGKERARVLAEIEELERARRAGEVGPRTYENARRELIDALARTLAGEAAAKSATA